MEKTREYRERGGREREEGEREGGREMRVYMDGKTEKIVVQNKREGLFKIILGFRRVEIRNLSRTLPIYLFLDWNSFREQSSSSPTLGYLSFCSTDRALWQVGERGGGASVVRTLRCLLNTEEQEKLQ